MKLLIICGLVLSGTISVVAQTISGQIKAIKIHNRQQTEESLPGANVFWENTTIGTVSNDTGGFILSLPEKLPHRLIISYVGYISDTLLISNPNEDIEVSLRESKDLQEVVIAERHLGAHYSGSSPTLTNVLTTHELQKGACCNLAEAFETNASVDVTYSDAITGAKQIQLLGLSGNYSLILTENIGSLRGLGQPYGLSFTPGPWMESIQIAKGTSSVIKGFDAISGLINVELKKPENSELFGANLYANSYGRVENSLIAAKNLNDKWSSMLMSHVEYLGNSTDHNNDGFHDHPLTKKYNITNRYHYEWHGYMESQFGFRFMQEKREGGQINTLTTPTPYLVDINTNRFEAQAKTGFSFQNQPKASLLTEVNYTYHEHKSLYGLRRYDATQNSLFTNVIYENIILNKEHTINTGISFMYDKYNELFDTLDLSREDKIPGIFAQYTYHSKEHFTAILGLRLDNHNQHGVFFTPRLHIRSNITEHATVRGSIGKGYRIPNLLAENTGLMISSRQFRIVEDIKLEEAWNYGLNLMQHFEILGNESSVAAEFYRTHFENQLVIDIDASPNEVRFYNLNGKSYANNYQIELKTSPVRFLDLTAALRYSDVKTTIGGTLQTKPFVSQYKGLITLSWQTNGRRWQFDLTSQFNGSSRIPDTSHLPEEWQMPEKSPAYVILLGQITYRLGNFDLYVGGENLTDYTQKKSIVGANDPFGPNFDASMIWGPIMGRTFYAGLRYKM